jgi:Protein of unknown function (DUF2846)
VRWGIVLIAAAALAGCAAGRDGAEFASITQTLGAPKSGQARIVVMREKGFTGLVDSGYAVTIDNRPMGELKTGTFIYVDAAAGRHELGAKTFAFPGDTRRELVASPGRTYFFNVVMSDRAKKLSGVAMVGGLAGFVVATAVTSRDENPGPIEFVPMEEAAARAAITELRLAPAEAPASASSSH